MRPWLKLITLTILLSIIYIYGKLEQSHSKEHTIPFDIKIAQPDQITCGPVSVMMLINHYGNKEVTLNQIKLHTKTVWFNYHGTDFGMTSPNYISVALDKYGIHNRIRRGNLDVLKHYICLNKPCIILVRTGQFLWHYVVVVGYTEEKILIYDTNGTSYYVDNERFLKFWSWESDMDGVICEDNEFCMMLRILEVYPHTFIVPD